MSASTNAPTTRLLAAASPARTGMPLLGLALLLVMALGPWLLGCGPRHIKGYTPRHREYPVAPAPAPNAASEPNPGSLLRNDSPHVLFADQRAFRASDVLVVRIEEVADAQRQSGVDVERSGASEHVLRAVPGVNRVVNRTLNPNPAFNLTEDTHVDGEGRDAFAARGTTGRTERFVATVPVVVRQVLPNGNLFVEGHRVILVNEEEHHFYVSGVVRPIDVDQNNAVRSSQVADAEIEFVGRGVVTDNQQEGWLRRIFGFLRPF